MENELAPADIFIQWKGTDVCFDFHCYKCDCFSHFDGDFCYFIQCPRCNTIYSMPSVVPLKLAIETDLNINDNVKVASIVDIQSAKDAGWKPHKAREIVSFVGEK